MSDYISRADAIEAVLSIPMPLRLADEIDEVLRLLPSADAEYMQVEADTLPPKVPPEWITQGMILLPLKDYEKLRNGLEEWQSVADMPHTEPSVSAERVGVWIWCGDKGDSRFMCSVCKSKENVPTCMGEPSVWDYCPNCGARMK